MSIDDNNNNNGNMVRLVMSVIGLVSVFDLKHAHTMTLREKERHSCAHCLCVCSTNVKCIL